ncbi:MAG TPA: hypothetical protein DFS52_25020 [Myxococcales bacterium]|jgi:hypothetical protein|nr:hypothetical protein [Myxococcales bacterium]
MQTNQAGQNSRVADDDCVLSYIAAFHRLRQKADQGSGLTLEEGRILASLLSMFERRQVTEGRLVRSLVKLRLERPARFVAGQKGWQGVVREANLLHVGIAFAEPPPSGHSGELEIEGEDGTRWRFNARVTRSETGKTVLALGAPLGHAATLWQAA